MQQGPLWFDMIQVWFLPEAIAAAKKNKSGLVSMAENRIKVVWYPSLKTAQNMILETFLNYIIVRDLYIH